MKSPWNSLIGEQPQESPVFKWLAVILIPAGSVLLMLVQRFDERSPTMRWQDLAVYAFVLATAAAIAYELMPHVRACGAALAKCSSRRRARLENRPRVVECCRKLGRHLEDNHDSLVRLLRDAEGWEEVRTSGQRVHSGEHVSTLKSWHHAVSRQLEISDRKAFFATAAELAACIYQFNSYLIEMHRPLERLVLDKKMQGQREAQLKKDWTMRREDHQALMREWKEIVGSVNRQIGEHTMQDYYPDLPPLSS